MKQPDTNENKRIVFFDGVCNLCNHAVDFLVRHDHHRYLRYSSLQGRTAQILLRGLVPQHLVDDLQSILYYENGHVYTQSDAAIRIMKGLGGVWKFAAVFLMIPRELRDSAYHFIATRRYQLFGKRDVCRVPTAEERTLFLD